MRVGVDAELVGRDRSGNETYLRGMIGGLQERCASGDRLILVTTSASTGQELAGPKTSVVRTRKGLIGDLLLGSVLRRAGADVAVASYTAPVAFPGPVATVVHDLAYLRFPETFPTWLRRRIAWTVRRSVRLSDLIVTSSEFSRSELSHFFPELDPDRIVVTYSAASPAFLRDRDDDELERVRRRHRLPRSFVLAVGNVQPRKNVPRLAQATSRIGVPLVVVGQPLWRHQEVLDAVGQGVDTRWLGFVPTGDLACLYRLCSVFAYPSLYEGFGLPVVEAMGSGAPVVTSSTTSLPEVAGDAAVLVDPTCVDSIAAGIEEVLTSRDRAAQLSESGRRRAMEFSWAASAQVLLDRLRSLR